MENNLITYLDKRLQNKPEKEGLVRNPGPVITISREVGCNALKVARELASRLNQHDHENRWKVISKEILYESAKELHLEPDRVNRFLKQTDRYTLDEILNTFSYKHFVSEKKIINTVIDVIHSFAMEGFCIIVGRGGNIIAKDIHNSLHIKMFADLEYRISSVMENNPFNRKQAIEFIHRIESERIAFRKSVTREIESEDLIHFDLMINRASYSTEGVVGIILEALKQKNILVEYPQKVFIF